MKTFLFFILSFVLSGLITAQERRELRGRVVSDEAGASLPGLFVINKASGEETKTNTTGNFTIMARPGDVLVVYSTTISVREFRLNENSFKEQPYVLSVSRTAYEMEEIVINKDLNLTSESLGLVPKGQKRYTPAERKLYTATSGLGIGTIVGLDPIINAITGKTRMLKQAVETERKEMLIDKINGIVTEQEIAEEYKIPAENVKGFIFYVAEDKEFAAAMKAGNEALARFLLTGLAKKYLNLLADE